MHDLTTNFVGCCRICLLLRLCGQPGLVTFCCVVCLCAGDIGREQLSEAVIGYNDVEHAKVRGHHLVLPTWPDMYVGLDNRLASG